MEISKTELIKLAKKYGVTLNDKKPYPSFSCHCEDLVDGIGWGECLNIYNEFGKTTIHEITGIRYRTHCRYIDDEITLELVEKYLKDFVGHNSAYRSKEN